ncbi:hypothetical protein G3I76_38615, partial [Streptomyces sp. SID11233]|nr:hypothetical protein [Streptomyces sp. SID11233]
MTAPTARTTTGTTTAPGATTADPLLEVRGITKSYGGGDTARQVLGGIHFAVGE